MTTLFQRRVASWAHKCFGSEAVLNITERHHRFLEEALELVQATGCTKDEVMQLVDYVYGRKKGDVPQEVGGVLLTLAALCTALDLSMESCGYGELDRVHQKIEQIRAKQAAKPEFGPLPGPTNTE